MDCVNIASISNSIRAIGKALLNGSNWTDILNEVTDDRVEILQNRVQEFINSIESSINMPLNEYIVDFSNKKNFAKIWLTFQNSLLNEFSRETKSTSQNQYAEASKTVNDIKLEFGSGDPEGYDRVLKNFKKNASDSSILHITTDGSEIVDITSPLSGSKLNQDETLNKNLFEFKKSLLKQINVFTNVNTDVSFGMNDGLFTEIIVNALTNFEQARARTENLTSPEYLAALDAYITLKYFDVFIDDLKYISPKPAFKNSAGYSTQMYTYTGMRSNPASHFGKNELQHATKVNSPLLETVFDNMPEVKYLGKGKFVLKSDPSKGQVMVGQGAFMNIMSHFKHWLASQTTSNGENAIMALAELDTDELNKKLEQFLNLNLSVTPDYFSKYKVRYPDKLAGIYAVLHSNMNKNILDDI